MNWRVRRGLGIVGLIAFGTGWLSAAEQAAASSPPLAAAIAIDAGCEVSVDRGVTAFAATLRNTGDADTAVMVGIALGNGAIYHPTDIVLLVSTDDGESDEYVYTAGAISGRVDPWVVPLPQGATYQLRIPTSRLYSMKSRRVLDMGYSKGSWRARLVLRARHIAYGVTESDWLPLLRLTTGTFESAAIQSPESCSRSSGDRADRHVVLPCWGGSLPASSEACAAPRLPVVAARLSWRP